MKNYLLTQHNLPQTLKTIIYDSIHNQHTQTHFKTSQYLLKINASHQAEVFFFNTQLTSITSNLKIKYLKNERCFSFRSRQQTYKIVTCNKQEIIIYRARVDLGGQFQKQFQTYNFKINLQKNEEIIYISDSISLANHEYYIAYTNKDNFYLISTRYDYRKYQFYCVKLIDLDESQGIFGWFMKQEKRHYSTVKLHLVVLSTGQQAIRMVSVRDNQIMIHLVEIKPLIQKSTISLIQKLEKFSSLLSDKSVLLDTFLLKNESMEDSQLQTEHTFKFIVVLKQKAKTEFINVEIYLSQTQRKCWCNRIFTLQQSFFLSMVSSHQLFFFCWFNNLTKKYIVNLFDQKEITALKNQSLFGARPYLQEDNQIFPCNGHNGVYFFTESNIFIYEKFDSRMKESAIHLKSIKKLQQILNKSVQIEDFDNIADILRKIEDNYKLILKTQDDYFKNYLCTFILRKVLESTFFNQLQRLIKSSPICRERGENVLIEACKQIEIQNIQLLIESIAKLKMYELLANDVVYQVIKQFSQNANEDACKKFLYEIFNQGIDITLGELSFQLQKSNQNLKWYLLLINSFVYFKQIEPQHLEAIISHNENKFIQKIIVNYQKMDLFLSFFNHNFIEFDASDIKQLFSKAEKNQIDVESYIKRLIVVSYQEWKNKELYSKEYYLELVKKRFTTLIQGLKKYQETLIESLQNTLPGLAVYFYIKKDRKKYADKLFTLASKNQNPEISYILMLAAGRNKKSDKATLDQMRLCHQLKQNNLAPQELVSQIKKNDFNDVEVRRQTWQSWKDSHENLRSDFSLIQKKLSFYKNE